MAQEQRLNEVNALIAKAGKMAETACQTCLSCGHFVEKTEMCNLYNQRPPARVIAFGCPAYDFIPF